MSAASGAAVRTVARSLPVSSTPLALVDSAARVCDPIVRGEAGDELFGVFLKDYRPSQW